MAYSNKIQKDNEKYHKQYDKTLGLCWEVKECSGLSKSHDILYHGGTIGENSHLRALCSLLCKR